MCRCVHAVHIHVVTWADSETWVWPLYYPQKNKCCHAFILFDLCAYSPHGPGSVSTSALSKLFTRVVTWASRCSFSSDGPKLTCSKRLITQKRANEWHSVNCEKKRGNMTDQYGQVKKPTIWVHIQWNLLGDHHNQPLLIKYMTTFKLTESSYS